jgi:hypothetical protein
VSSGVSDATCTAHDDDDTTRSGWPGFVVSLAGRMHAAWVRLLDAELIHSTVRDKLASRMAVSERRRIEHWAKA